MFIEYINQERMIAMAKNQFLAEKKAREQKILEIGENVGFQRMWDLVQLALRDPKVVGKNGAWGSVRLERLFNALMQINSDFGDAFTLSPEADYLQQKMDDMLREIWGDKLVPFNQRFEYIQNPGYDKPRKEWR